MSQDKHSDTGVVEEAEKTNDLNSQKIDFGYTQVDKDKKVDMVADVFHSVAAK